MRPIMWTLEHHPQLLCWVDLLLKPKELHKPLTVHVNINGIFPQVSYLLPTPLLVFDKVCSGIKHNSPVAFGPAKSPWIIISARIAVLLDATCWWCF